MSDTGPFISRALFCERIDEAESGAKSFINTVDTLNFRLDDPDTDLEATPLGWKGMLEFEVSFAEYAGEIVLEMVQREDSSGERTQGLEQRFNTSDFPGILAVSIALEFSVAYNRTGIYWYEFYLNGDKKTQVPLTVTLIE